MTVRGWGVEIYRGVSGATVRRRLGSRQGLGPVAVVEGELTSIGGERTRETSVKTVVAFPWTVERPSATTQGEAASPEGRTTNARRRPIASQERALGGGAVAHWDGHGHTHKGIPSPAWAVSIADQKARN
jgi:hypothetical protein